MPLTLRERCLREARDHQLRFLRNENLIEARSELLDPADRDLVKAVLIFGQPTRMIADLSNVSPDAVRYRLRRLLGRLNSAEFVGVARSMHLLNAEQSAVARDHILHGKSLRATARTVGMPYHAARKVLAEVRGIIEGMKNLKKNYPSLGNRG